MITDLLIISRTTPNTYSRYTTIPTASTYTHNRWQGREQWVSGKEQWAAGKEQWAAGNGQWAAGKEQWAAGKGSGPQGRNSGLQGRIEGRREGTVGCWVSGKEFPIEQRLIEGVKNTSNQS